MNLLISGSHNAFADGFNGAGCYMISGLAPSNTFKLPIYIGGAQDLQTRIERAHLVDLKLNKHINGPLQNYYNKHGAEKIVVWCLETSDVNECFKVEQNYLDLYKPFTDEFGGFNISHFATSPMRGRKHTAEAKLKIAAAGKGRKHSEETREKLRQINTGKKQSAEHRRKNGIAKTGIKQSQEQINKKSKTYSFTNPEGEPVIIRNLNKFCKENGLNQGTMCQVGLGKANQHRGWRKLTTAAVE